MRARLGLSFIAVAVSGALLFAGACEPKETAGKKTERAETPQSGNSQEKQDCKDVHWTHHHGKNGPEDWQNLCEEFAACGGKQQSPIDIATDAVEEDAGLRALQFHYGTSKAHIVNNGHTVQFNVDGEHTVRLNGKTYTLLQFHYHAPSEHTFNGEHFPLEVHFVHKYADDDLAVLGVMFVEGDENAFLKEYLDIIPAKKGEVKSDRLIELLGLFPQNKSYFNYSGSLTTPPCSEVVNWYVLQHPVEASKEQLVRFATILNNNYRPVQPLNERKVRLYRD